jgi:hypothetical protein
MANNSLGKLFTSQLCSGAEFEQTEMRFFEVKKNIVHTEHT